MCLSSIAQAIQNIYMGPRNLWVTDRDLQTFLQSKKQKIEWWWHFEINLASAAEYELEKKI